MANKNTSDFKVKALTTKNGRDKRTNKAISARLITAERTVTKLEKQIDEGNMEYQEILAQLEVLKKMNPGKLPILAKSTKTEYETK